MKQSLKKGALSLLDSLIMAVAGAAPAYSITASTAALIGAVGLAGPAALCVAFPPMLGITIAFSYLNHARPNAGAGYAWVSEALNPAWGFLAGWALLCSSTLFMVAAALPAGEATLDLLAPDHVHDPLWALGFGALWFLGVLAVVSIGITASAKAQMFLTCLEVGALALICGLVIAHAQAAPVAPFAWSWFSPSSFGSFPTLAAGMLVAAFYFAGWDVSANLAEETAHAKVAAGLGGIIGVLVIFCLFVLAQVAVQMSLTTDEIQANSANLLPALSRAALPAPWGSISVLAVLFSAVATIETQILQCTRLLFSMARDGVIGEPMGRLHPRFQTPLLAGFAVAAASLLLFAVSTMVPSINALMSGLISAIGMQISLYYCLGAFACAVSFRGTMLTDWRALVFAGVIPAASALFLAGVAAYQLPQIDWRISFVSIGSILTGILPFLYYRRRTAAVIMRSSA